MSTAPNTQPARVEPAVAYRQQVEKMTLDIIRSLVGEARMREAAGRFTVAFRAAAMAAPGLYEARPQSVANAIALCALTGLQPGGPMPLCYLIPRKEKNPATGRWDIPGIQWMASWRGMKALVERTGARITAVPVFHGEEFSVVRGLRPDLVHVPNVDANRSWDNLRAVYVIVRLPDGSTEFEILGKQAIEQRRDASDSWRRYQAGDAKDSPWATWPIEQAIKTGIRYAISRGIAPIDETGLLAYEREGDADRPEVIDVAADQARTTLRPVPTERQIAAKLSGLDDLAAEFGEREPVMAQADDDILTPAERVREEAKPEGRSGKGGRGKGSRGGDAQPEALPPEAQFRVGLIADVKAGLSAIGTDFVGMAYEQAGLQPSRRPEDLTTEELVRLLERCRAIADAEGA